LFPDRESLTQRFEDFLVTIHAAVEESGLSAAVYTQTSDIETENNGLMTYDREVMKIDAEAVSLANLGYLPPRVVRRAPIFLDRTTVEFAPAAAGASIRYTTDGADPSAGSRLYEQPFEISESTTIKSRAFYADGTASRVSAEVFTKAETRAAVPVQNPEPGLLVEYYEQDGDWRALPDFDALTPAGSSVVTSVDLTAAPSRESFGLRFRGFISVAEDGVYGFHLTSDDGSRLLVGGDKIVDNDGVHGARERSGYIALGAGLHPMEVIFFQGGGGVALTFELDGPGFERRVVNGNVLFH
jgi:hexosaminidase